MNSETSQLRFIETHANSDDTWNYNVEGAENCFIVSFISFLQDISKEGGKIYISDGKEYWFGEADAKVVIEYDFKFNNMVSILKDRTHGEWQDYIIKSIKANGGGGLMNYGVLVEPYDEGLA